MDEKAFVIDKFDEPTRRRLDKTSLLFTALALVIGLAISVIVWQVGWIALITIPAVIVLVSTVWNPDLGLVALILLIFTQFQRVVTEFHNLPGPGRPLVALLLLVVAIRLIIFNERPATWLRNSFIIGIYLIFLMISVLTAGVLSPALSELIDVAQNLVIASVVLYIIQRSSSLRIAIWAVIAAGLFMASITVFQRLTGSYDQLYWGFGGWEYSGYVGRPRLTGPYATPNPYAQVLVLIFVMALDRMWHERGLLLRFIAGVAVILTALAMIYTDSRGGFANMVFTIFVFFLFNRPSFPSLLLTLLLGVSLIQFLPSNYTDRILTLTQLVNVSNPATVTDESFRSRTSENLAAWRMFLDHPVFGVGLNNYAEHYQDYSRQIGFDPRREARDPASLYLQLLADQGLIGTIVFLSLIASVFANLLRAHRDFKIAGMFDEANMASALFAALAGYMFMSIYKNSAYTNVFWVLVAMCMSVTQIATNTLGSDDEAGKSLELVS